MQGALPEVLNTTLTVHHQIDLVVQLLDSRASRMSPNQALLTLHVDYIGGQHPNYRKWYFTAQLDLNDAISSTQNPGLQRLRSQKHKSKGHKAVERQLHSVTAN